MAQIVFQVDEDRLHAYRLAKLQRRCETWDELFSSALGLPPHPDEAK